MHFEDAGPFRPLAADVSALPGILRERGFTSAALTELGVLSTSSKRDLPLHERLFRAGGGGDLELLARLFVLAREEEEAAVERVLAPLGVGPLVVSGLLVRAEGGRIRASAAVIPVAELTMVREFYPSVTGKEHGEVEVLPVGRASVIAGLLAPREAGQRVLDLGCGQGVQMVLASAHASRVVGTDVSAKSLNFAAMNLALNRPPREVGAGPLKTEVRLGSVFEPVVDLKGSIDLIVSNPPFVITPERGKVAFSAEMEGDAIVERIVSGAPEHLAEGGWCVTLGSWIHQNQSDFSDRPTAWASGKGCDVLVGRFTTYTPRDYAIHWLQEFGQGKDFTAETMENWTAYYQRLGAGAISYGFIALRKRSAARLGNWSDAVSASLDVNGGTAGDGLRRLFAARTLLHGAAAGGGVTGSMAERDAILGARLKLSPTAELRTRSKIIDEQWGCVEAKLVETRGFSASVDVSQELSQVLSICDGDLTLGQIITLVARQGDLDREELARSVLPKVRELLGDGMLAV
jgi:predicted RNA methylase